VLDHVFKVLPPDDLTDLKLEATARIALLLENGALVKVSNREQSHCNSSLTRRRADLALRQRDSPPPAPAAVQIPEQASAESPAIPQRDICPCCNG
jgi:hypothetical protein